MTASIVWFRRDLRLGDNPAWARGTQSDRVIPLFVIDPGLFRAVSSRRRSLLVGGLQALDQSLQILGGRLRVEIGDPSSVVPTVAGEGGADVVHVNREVTPYGVARDERVARLVNVERSEGLYVHPPGSVLTAGGRPYRVFTPFYRAWSKRTPDVLSEPGSASISDSTGAGIPSIPGDYPAGEQKALGRLDRFATRVDRYYHERDRPDLDVTSHLSIDLKYGWLGARTVFETITSGTEGASALIRQLAWRDFFGHVLAEAPEIVHEPMRPEYRTINWHDDEAGFAAWQSGMTGYPIIDAGMRQLVAEGWIHNRVRLLAASFLVKDLLVDWRKGERFFRRQLLDADVAQNVGNWQWVAGTGSDAAPYFRIFNPVTQSRRFDPDGGYIRRWVPEIAALPNELMHAPWETEPRQLAAFGVELGVTYPQPIVEHSMARARALAAYEAARSRD